MTSDEECMKFRKKNEKKSIEHFTFDNANLGKLGKNLIGKGLPCVFLHFQDTDSINSHDLKHELIDLD